MNISRCLEASNQKKVSRRSYITGTGEIPKEKHNEWGASFTPSPPNPNHRPGDQPEPSEGLD